MNWLEMGTNLTTFVARTHGKGACPEYLRVRTGSVCHLCVQVESACVNVRGQKVRAYLNVWNKVCVRQA
jgi:hypothetical protein